MAYKTGEKTNKSFLKRLDVFLSKKKNSRKQTQTKKTKFCIADVKKAPRCGVKLQEYQHKKNMDQRTAHISSHSHLQDIIRGSFVLSSS